MPHAIIIKNSLDALKFLQVGATGMMLYSVLSRKPMTISELKLKTGLSERILRAHLASLLDRDFIKREILQGDRLMYKYSSNKPENILRAIESKVYSIEKARKSVHRDILNGSKFSIKKR